MHGLERVAEMLVGGVTGAADDEVESVRGDVGDEVVVVVGARRRRYHVHKVRRVVIVRRRVAEYELGIQVLAHNLEYVVHDPVAVRRYLLAQRLIDAYALVLAALEALVGRDQRRLRLLLLVLLLLMLLMLLVVECAIVRWSTLLFRLLLLLLAVGARRRRRLLFVG